MIIKDTVLLSQYQPVVPNSLRKRIDFYYTCELTKTEASSLTRVLVGLEKMLANDSSIKPELWAHIVFLGDKNVHLEFEDYGGEYSPFIWYKVYGWRELNYTPEQTMLVMTEELCHCFWSIRDEAIVKEKVKELMRTIGLVVSWPDGFQF